MTDLLLDYLNNDTNSSEWDLVFEDNDIVTTNNLQNAVLISLFTDARASEDDDIPGDDMRGWWGDQVLPDVEGDEIGSKLWLLERSKTISGIEAKAKEYILNALQWMLDDGVAAKIDVSVERQRIKTNERLAFQIKIYQSDGNEIALKYSDKWEVQIGV